jgi:hypothetical protein
MLICEDASRGQGVEYGLTFLVPWYGFLFCTASLSYAWATFYFSYALHRLPRLEERSLMKMDAGRVPEFSPKSEVVRVLAGLGDARHREAEAEIDKTDGKAWSGLVAMARPLFFRVLSSEGGRACPRILPPFQV